MLVTLAVVLPLLMTMVTRRILKVVSIVVTTIDCSYYFCDFQCTDAGDTGDDCNGSYYGQHHSDDREHDEAVKELRGLFPTTQ